jgi:DNA-binding response OmpR family regulator
MFEARPILILEDEPLLAMALAEAVTALGGTVIGPIATVHDAHGVLDSQEVAAAILEVKLGDQDASLVALRLADAGIAVVLHTVSALSPEVTARWPDLPWLMKPTPAAVVANRLLAEIQRVHLFSLDNPHAFRAIASRTPNR